MTAPVALDGDLAWAIGDWVEKYRPQGVELPRDGIESLTRWLSHEGFGKVKDTSGDLSLSDLRNVLNKGAKAVEDLLKGPREPADKAAG